MYIPRRNESGFTLVELMIVVAIIGILAAIAVPQFMAYRTRSYNAAAKALAHNMTGTEADLNSEIGCYGHTEAVALNLLAPDNRAAVAIVDITGDPALAVAATDATPGGRIAGTHPVNARQFAVAIGFGPNMVASAIEETATPSAASAHVYARHIRGDTIYAIDNEAPTQVYSVSNATWVAETQLGTGAQTVAVADNVNDFDADGDPGTVGPPGGGMPFGTWAPVQ